MRKNKRKWMPVLVISLLFVCMAVVVLERSKVKIETETFHQSSRMLQNPNRGFYHIYTFYISDAKEDYETIIAEKYKEDTGTTLALIEINLQKYRDGKISEAGLVNIGNLFEALERAGKQLIVRFLYDWEGENLQEEPQELEIILTHMEQLEKVLHRYSASIFTMQGLFVGKWGEMNGTKFDTEEDLQKLAGQLAKSADPSTYLAVRTPAQWRSLSGRLPELSGRLGLFNDGMMGNESDWGTYEIQSGNTDGQREKELAFQEELCRQVPNGGEVIHDNPYNDFEHAVQAMASMHVTYINQEYDRAVLEKWKRTLVSEEGCFDGMDGLTYIERHLGYRLFLSEVEMSRKFLQSTVSVELSFQNAGFAPLYKEPEIQLTLKSRSETRGLSWNLSQSLRALPGGNQSEERAVLKGEIPVQDLPEGKYTVYLTLIDPDSGQHIQLANEQNETEVGYCIGTVSLQ